jgi:hypothetical protein
MPRKGIACAILDKKGFTPSRRQPQKYCPIYGGRSATVQFHYDNLAKYHGSPQWQKIVNELKLVAGEHKVYYFK